MKLTVGTFNVENLMSRIDYASPERPEHEEPEMLLYGLVGTDDYRILKAALTLGKADDIRQITAQAIDELDADILCLQEVESLDVLDRFNEQYLRKTPRGAYTHVYLVEGNDRRGIDVAVMAREPFPVSVRSHRQMQVKDLTQLDQWRQRVGPDLNEYNDRNPDRLERTVFNRDCLEIRLELPGAQLTVFNCHFKSMAPDRRRTRGERLIEAMGVRQIIEERFPDPATAQWLIVGDLNDHDEQILVRPLRASSDPLAQGEEKRGQFALRREAAGDSGLLPLTEKGFAESLIRRLPDPFERWTHYWAEGNAFSALDHMLASRRLAERNRGATPRIVRRGLPYRVPGLDVARYPRVGWDRPKASDHCPMAIEIEV